MKKTILILSLIIIGFSAFAQLDTLQNLDEMVVKSTRADAKSAMVFTNVGKNEISKLNLGQDVPFLLNQTPSVIISSDAGTGIGYTGIRIRGSDATRTNVTLNGIPYNDAESQGVFWVNLPDFASSVQSIQIQRGVGTSTNGAGALGASVNVNTLQLNREPMAEVSLSAGSFNTVRANFQASSGLINDRFVFDARLSKINSDGFVDRAFSDLKSYYLSGGYYHKNTMIRLNHFVGNETTYQSWNGIPQALAKGDMQGLDDYISRNGYDESFKNELLERGRRYNFYNYENETDNYLQSHWQLISSIQINQNWRFNPALFYVKGDGYYEQYKANRKLVDYNLPTITLGGENISRIDLIQRKYLDNGFMGGVWSLDYEGQGKIKTILGGGITRYEGGHFGEVIWGQYLSAAQINHRFYDNQSLKTDFNIYGKANYQLSPALNTYLDLQYRNVNMNMKGTSDVLAQLDFDNNWNFFNPKLGLTYDLPNQDMIFVSFARGTKEPNRSDFTDNAPNIPKPEKLNDYEAGYKWLKTKWSAETNVYFMDYKNQLVLTGEINPTGKDIRVNVPNSYRAGIELQFNGRLSEKIQLGANLTLSQNKIKDFTYTVPASDGTPDEVTFYKNTDISFSPNIIAGGNIGWYLHKDLLVSLLPKYVGKQYLDNTASEDKKLDAYFVSDLNVNYNPSVTLLKNVNFSLLVNNLFNKQYESNGYTYSYIYGEKVTENFVFPMAGTNFLIGMNWKFQ